MRIYTIWFTGSNWHKVLFYQRRLWLKLLRLSFVPPLLKELNNNLNMVGRERFERSTSGLKVRCSTD